MIVVVGAGIAGLSAALALSRTADVLVLERRSAVAANAGAGIQLSPNAMKALRAIGAEDAVAAVATAPTGLSIRSSARGRPLVRVPYGGMEQRYGAPYLTASRAALHTALASAVSARRTIEVRYDAPVRRVGSRDGRPVIAGVVGTVDLVVAADGVRSELRASLIGDAPQETGWIAWRGRGRPSSTDTELLMTPGHHLVRYALSQTDDNCVLVARERGRSPESLARTATGAHLADVTDWTPWPMRVRPRHAFRAGNVAFAGDAAHAMLPFLAQGGAMAMEDAAVLGEAVARHGAGAEALGAYEAARLPRTRKTAAQTERQRGIYHMPFPLCLARDAAMRRLGPDAVRARVDWLYRWSPSPIPALADAG